MLINEFEWILLQVQYLICLNNNYSNQQYIQLNDLTFFNQKL